MVQWHGSSTALVRRGLAHTTAMSTRDADLASRTADEASELYSKLERENRTRRFDRCVQRADQPA